MLNCKKCTQGVVKTYTHAKLQKCKYANLQQLQKCKIAKCEIAKNAIMHNCKNTTHVNLPKIGNIQNYKSATL